MENTFSLFDIAIVVYHVGSLFSKSNLYVSTNEPTAGMLNPWVHHRRLDHTPRSGNLGNILYGSAIKMD